MIRDLVSCGVDLADPQAFMRGIRATSGRMVGASFSPREVAEAQNEADGLTVRWAVKEAVAKALGTGLLSGVGLRDIEVVESGVPGIEVRLRGEAERVANELGIKGWHVVVGRVNGLILAVVVTAGRSEVAFTKEEVRNAIPSSSR